MSDRTPITASKRWVIKIGSALLTDQQRGLNASLVEQWIRQMRQFWTERLDALEELLKAEDETASSPEKKE